MKDNHIDNALRDAMKRRAGRVPALSDGFAEQIMGKVEARKRARHKRTVGLLISGVAAALAIAFILWPESLTEEPPKRIRNEATRQETIEKEKQPLQIPQAKQEHLVAAVKTEEAGVTMKASASRPTHDSPAPAAPSLTLPCKEEVAILGDASSRPAKHATPLHLREEQGSAQSVEDISPIPPDKQALADIYLAEVALQVFYQQQAAVGAVRAYQADITGEEPQQSIIAF